MSLPPCGIYKTTVAIGGVPEGRLVYFHNHGDPGPGVYLPVSWTANRAKFAPEGTTLPDVGLAESLEPLLVEGLYRVSTPFHCCEKQCRKYITEQLVQLGYNGRAEPILFVPEWIQGGLGFPEIGHVVDAGRLSKLSKLVVAASGDSSPGLANLN